MTKKIQVYRPVCSATAAGRVFGTLKALIKHDEQNPGKPACYSATAAERVFGTLKAPHQIVQWLALAKYAIFIE